MSPKKLNPQKVSQISDLKSLISDSKSIAVVDYKGLKVSQATELRKTIRKAGGHMVVTKNTLFSLAMENPDLKIEGPSAFIFSTLDETSAIKAVSDFAKKNSLPTFKIGFLGHQALTTSQITELANLPSKEVLIGKTVSALKSPLFSLAYNLNWNISKLVRTLGAISKSKTN